MADALRRPDRSRRPPFSGRPGRRAALTGLTAVLLTLAAAAAAGGGSVVSTGRRGLLRLPRPDPSAAARRTHGRVHLPRVVEVAVAVVGVVGVTVIVVLLVSVVGLLLWFFRPRLPWVTRTRRSRDDDLPDGPDAPIPDLASRLRAQLAAGLEDLGHADDPRRAVIACWLRLESAVAEAGIARRPTETSTELVVRVLAGQVVRREPLSRLAELFRRARFAPDIVPAQMRDEALAALRAVHADLAGAGAGAVAPTVGAAGPAGVHAGMAPAGRP